MFLWRSAGSPGGGEAHAPFADREEIAGYASDAVDWAWGRGILTGGPDGRFDLKGGATRAETAAVLSRLGEGAAGNTAEGEVGEELLLQISAGGRLFSAVLCDGPAAWALLERLPMTIPVAELNGNEKYHYLPEALPTAEQPGEIRAGDLMLYGADCLVLFYESFSTSYSDTPLGYVTEPEGPAEALRGSRVEVTVSQAARDRGGETDFSPV